MSNPDEAKVKGKCGSDDMVQILLLKLLMFDEKLRT